MADARSIVASSTDGARTAVLAALELAIDVVYHDGTARDLAVASEAYRLAGYVDPTCCTATHATREQLGDAIARARRGRQRRLLEADGRGMLAAFTMLAAAEVITWSSCSQAKHLRWLGRGGHGGESRAARWMRLKGDAA